MGETLDTKPRFKGAPPLCLKHNLPAFVTADAMEEFLKETGPSVKVRKKWLCDFCSHYHAETYGGKGK